MKTDRHEEELKMYRNQFITMAKRQQFLHAELVRARGSITGFLTDKLGLIETDDTREDGKKKAKVFFRK